VGFLGYNPEERIRSCGTDERNPKKYQVLKRQHPSEVAWRR
jgi:hypothetical protein